MPSTKVRQPGIDLPTWLRAVLMLDPDADALQFEGRWWTWGWMAAGVDSLERLLDAAGFGDGTKVGVLMRNRPAIVRTVAATLATRNCLVTLSPAIPIHELSGEIGRLRLPVVIAGEADWANEHLHASVAAAGSIGVAAGEEETPYRVVVQGGPRAAGVVDSAPGVAIQMLTSGTTGP
ncbi:MAG TPA: AMP-binding protein, partial [Ilumatobacter sp.]